jgi:hypothetical protein
VTGETGGIAHGVVPSDGFGFVPAADQGGAERDSTDQETRLSARL